MSFNVFNVLNVASNQSMSMNICRYTYIQSLHQAKASFDSLNVAPCIWPGRLTCMRVDVPESSSQQDANDEGSKRDSHHGARVESLHLVVLAAGLRGCVRLSQCLPTLLAGQPWQALCAYMGNSSITFNGTLG